MDETRSEQAKCIHGITVDVVRDEHQRYRFAPQGRRQCPECIVQAVLDAMENQTRPLHDQV